MTAFRLILPLALVGAAGLVLAPTADAAPLPSAAALAAVLPGGVDVDVGVGFGGHGRVRHYEYDHLHGGYWTWRTTRVWVPPRMIGYDHHGYPIHSPGHWTYRRTRVWVPVVHRHHEHEYEPGHGWFGGRVRFR